MTSIAPQWHYGFSRFADSISDWKPAFEAILKDFKKGQVEQFVSQGSYGTAGGWRPLSPRYAAWKEAHRPGMPILVFSGLLKEAATNPKAEIGKDSLKIIIDDEGSYQLFSKRQGRMVTKHKPAVAAYHQKGGGRLPKRAVIQLPQSQIVRWRKIFHQYMVYQSRAPWGPGGLR